MEFVPVGKSTDVPAGAVTAFELRGTRVAVANVEGTLYGFDDVSPIASALWPKERSKVPPSSAPATEAASTSEREPSSGGPPSGPSRATPSERREGPSRSVSDKTGAASEPSRRKRGYSSITS